MTALVAVGCFVGCSDHPAPPSVRGIILISLDTLSAEHLGLYGYHRDTSPFLDRLSERAVVFDNAIVQLPGTLPSHMSIFTGLYPSEHDVFPVDSVLSEEIPTFPELLKAGGYRTAGHTENGYVSGRYGFSRGFDEWDDERFPLWYGGDTFLVRGLRFLESLAPDERFFLFLHTYAVHDPYNPPKDCQAGFWQGAPPEAAPPPSSETLLAHNQGLITVSPEIADYFRALYDEEIRCLDGFLERFFADLDGLGILKDSLVIITADHGEEFLEHGKLGHDQIYNENLHVPLIMVFPGQEHGVRVGEVVESIDIMPTILEFAGIVAPEHISGRSLAPLAMGGESLLDGKAYSRSFRASGHEERSLYERQDGELFHLLSLGRGADDRKHRGGVGVSSYLNTRIPPGELVFEATAFEVPSVLQVFLEGEFFVEVDLDPDQWTRVAVPRGEGAGSRLLRLSSATCVDLDTPEGLPRRCRSFSVRGIPLRRSELYRTESDTWESVDLSLDLTDVTARMLHETESRNHQPLSPATEQVLERDLEEELRALGYIQ